MITQPRPLQALVVDDEAITRGMVVFALLNEGFVCDVATDGEKAKVLLDESRYDLLVTDLLMPYMDGNSLVIHAMGTKSPPKIIVHTAHEDPRSVKDLIVRGVDDVVSKPTDYAVFAAKARAIVARRRVDVLQPNHVDSTSEMALSTEVSPVEEPLESPRVSEEEAAAAAEEEEEVEQLDMDLDSLEVNNSRKESAKDPSPAAATPRVTSATRNAPVRAQNVFKVTDRPSASTSGSWPVQDTHTLASKSRVAKRILAFIIAILIMTIAGAALLTTVITAPETCDARLTVSEISSPAAVSKVVTAELALPSSETATKLMSRVWALASEQIASLQIGRSRLVKLARALLAREQSLADSDTQSLTAVAAPEDSRAEQWSSSLGQALTALSTGAEDLSKYLQHAIEEHAATDQLKYAQQEERSAPIPGETDLNLSAVETRLGKSMGDGLMLTRNAERPLAADRAQLEAEFNDDLPEIKTWLAPLLKIGYKEGPASLTALRNRGALSNSEEGLYNLAMAMGFGNDRKSAGILPVSGGTLREEHRMFVVQASRLLLKYESLLVEKGMLAE